MPSFLGAPEVLIIALLVFVLFGFKKLPDAARAVGKSARVFKAEVSELKVEEEARKQAGAAQPGAASTTAADSAPITQTPVTTTVNPVASESAPQGFPAQASGAVQDSAQVVEGVVQNPPTNGAS